MVCIFLQTLFYLSLCKKFFVMRHILLFLTFAFLLSCEQIDHALPDSDTDLKGLVSSRDVARMLSSLPLGAEQLGEVFDAVSSSSRNGYDEEYTMEDLFTLPGAGVGDKTTKATPKNYSVPLKDMIAEYLSGTKAGETPFSASDLQNSGLQLYWPWYDKWDKTSYPAITFDPGDGSSSNIAYQLSKNEDGSVRVKEIVVNEAYAAENPVWIVNANDDATYTSLELLRRELAQGEDDAEIIIGKRETGAPLKTLVLSSFTMLSNYDSWLAGGSEFFIKCGSVENFNAATEAELKLYNPYITDFMIEVRRKEVGIPQRINTILVDNWTDQLERCAFMITEDDGGTWTHWNAVGEVKIKSKTYGFNVDIPYRSQDDIVWRGSLSYDYFDKYRKEPGRFGEVEVTFDFVERY